MKCPAKVRLPVLKETHYYPFGLTMDRISTKAINKLERNKKGFNGNELQNEEFGDGSGLELYDFNARTYDQQISRFIQIDPLSDKQAQETQTPYHFGFNNPMKNNDPTGKCPTCPPGEGELIAMNRGKLGTGVVESAVETATGLYQMVTSPVETAKGLAFALSHPIETAKTLYNNVVADFKADPEKATGKVLGNVIQTIVGGAIAKAVKEAKQVSRVGDLTKKEVKQIQNVVDQAERPLEVVGSAAAGERRGRDKSANWERGRNKNKK